MHNICKNNERRVAVIEEFFRSHVEDIFLLKMA